MCMSNLQLPMDEIVSADDQPPKQVIRTTQFRLSPMWADPSHLKRCIKISISSGKGTEVVSGLVAVSLGRLFGHAQDLQARRLHWQY